MIFILMIRNRKRTLKGINSWTCVSLCYGRYGRRILGILYFVHNYETIYSHSLSKSYYLQQVHQPRHLSNSARLFASDYLELTSRTVWYVVPLIWLPIAFYLFLRSALQFAGPLPPFSSSPFLPLSSLHNVTNEALAKTLICFFTGNIIWTMLEYGMHRFLFHIDEWLPDRPFFLMLHFLLHGIHHYLPMDRCVSFFCS
jgi:4-hydroxysphinganine ceramide fatty acyl 2-hydroxylase